MTAVNKGEEPIEYLQGYTDFLGCKIDLSKRPLIPRQETEYWTRAAIIDLCKISKKDIHVLDIFSGSGCIGIAVAKNLPGTKVDFSDVDPRAIEQININVDLNMINRDRVQVYLSDLFKNIPDKNKYDAILANPPYIDPNRIKEIQSSVINFEPGIGLFGGKRGLEVIAKFLRQAKTYLKPQGFIYMEFDPDQKDEIRNLLKKEEYSKSKFFKDQFNCGRFVKFS